MRSSLQCKCVQHSRSTQLVELWESRFLINSAFYFVISSITLRWYLGGKSSLRWEFASRQPQYRLHNNRFIEPTEGSNDRELDKVLTPMRATCIRAHTHTHTSSLAMKRSDATLFAGKWIQLEMIVLSGWNLPSGDTCFHSFVGPIFYSYIPSCMYIWHEINSWIV